MCRSTISWYEFPDGPRKAIQWRDFIFLTFEFVGGCGDRRGQPEPAVAVVPSRHHDGRGQEGGQGVRAEVAQGADGSARGVGPAGQQVPSGGPVLFRSGHGRGLCGLFDFVSLDRCMLVEDWLTVLGCCITKSPLLGLRRSCEGGIWWTQDHEVF